MASIYKLVAERRDRNQSMRRKKSARNINLFKDSLEGVEIRRPALYRHQTFRQRTVSDQPNTRELQLPRGPTISIRKSSSDISMINIKNQIKDVDTKIGALTKKLDDLANNFVVLHKLLNKN